ncbi:MAG: hypothetical protein PHD63_04630, partial [Candidatus Marinimicrobia bacterium]|nr:hypothetical protein [Candidatus Neomarinimicrobiota bacterium]
MKHPFSRITVLLWILLAGTRFTAAAHNQESLFLEPGKTLYPLKYGMVQVDSLKGADKLEYLIDALYGRVILLQAPAFADTLRIYYRYSTVNAPRKLDLGIGRIDTWFPEESQITATAPGRDLSDVRTSGSVSRKIEVGSTGQSLLSGGLDLRISGELSPGVFINGIISDQDAPFQDYASTQSVQDVDNILIRIYSDRFDSEIGDVYVNSDWNYWSRFQRKLIGAQMRYRGESYTGAAFAGSAKGQFRRQEIPARDADQGPYRLIAEDGERAITIVPQSERIYVDGVVLNKSQYTLYYNDAELFFSSDMMISASSRIVAEFNYVNEFYPRSSLGAMSAWHFGPNIRLQASYIREKDDERNPADVHLANIPADSLSGLVSQDGYFTISTAFADSAGAYVLSGDVWLFAGDGEGTHSVYFYRENRNGGYVRSYDEAGIMYYVHAPNDPFSQYFPRRKVTLPLTRQIGAMHLELGQKGKPHLLTEGAYSSFRANNYNAQSSRGSAALKWDADIPVGNYISLQSNGWFKGRDFSAFSNLNEPDFERALAFGTSDTVTQIANISAAARFPWLNSQNSLEYAAASSGERRLRLLSRGDIRAVGMTLNYQWSHLLDRGFLPYYTLRASLNAPLGKDLVFRANILRDHLEPVFSGITPYRSETATAGFTLKQWELNYSYRRDFNWQNADSLFESFSRKHDVSLRFDTAFWSRRITLNSKTTYRFDQRKTDDSHYILSSSQLGYNFPKMRLSGNIRADINRTSETKREAVFIYVGDGLGYYRLDDFGQYVPDEMGNFIMRSELTNERRDQYVSKLGSSLQWRAGKKKLRFEFSHAGNSDFRSPRPLLYAPVNTEAPDTSLLFSSLRLKHEAALSNVNGRHRLALLLEDQFGQNFQTAYNENAYSRNERRLQYRFKPEKLILELYYSYNTRDQHRMPLNSYRVQTGAHGLGANFEYLFSGKLRASLEGKYACVNTRFRDDFITHRISLKSDLIWYRVAGERFFLSGTLDRILSDYTGSLPYETADGLPLGTSWSAAL